MDRGVSELTTKRLSLYLRLLAELGEQGVETVSSREMARRCQLNAAQVRRDLATFGEFGVRGVGYRVDELRQVIEVILGLDRGSGVVIVGAGNLGNALGDYPGFNGQGFEIVALFDVDRDKVGGETRRGKPIRHVDELRDVVAEAEVEIGIVAVPAASAQQVVDRLVAAGVRAILNFAPARPEVPEGITCRHVDLSVELESLSYVLAGPVTPRRIEQVVRRIRDE